MFKTKKGIISLIICAVFFLGIVATAGITMAFFGGNASDSLNEIRLKNALTLNMSSDAVTSNFTVVPGDKKDIYLTGVVTSNGSSDTSVGGVIRAKVNINFNNGPVVGALNVVQDTKINGTQVYWNLADDGCYYLVSGSATSTNLYSVEPTTAGVNVTLHLQLGVSLYYDETHSGKKFNLQYQMTAGQDEIYNNGTLQSNTIANATPVFTDLEASAPSNITSNVKSNVYTELTYLQSSGATQYINTGVAAGNDVGIKVKYAALNTKDSIIVGCCGAGDARLAINTNTKLFVSWNIYDGSIGATSTLQAVTEASINYKNSRERRVNGVAIKPITNNLNANTYNIYMFAGAWRSANASLFANCRIYACQITKANAVVRNYVPVRSGTGVLGMYDLKNSQFYQNSGTGTFTAGADKF